MQKQNWASTRPPHSKPHKPLPPPSHTLPITLPHPLQHLPTSKHPILPPLLTPSHPTLNRGTPHPHPHHPQVTPHLTDGLSSTASLIKRNALPALLPCSTPQPATLTVCLLHPGPQPLAHPNQPPLITSTHTHTHTTKPAHSSVAWRCFLLQWLHSTLQVCRHCLMRLAWCPPPPPPPPTSKSCSKHHLQPNYACSPSTHL